MKPRQVRCPSFVARCDQSDLYSGNLRTTERRSSCGLRVSVSADFLGFSCTVSLRAGVFWGYTELNCRRRQGRGGGRQGGAHRGGGERPRRRGPGGRRRRRLAPLLEPAGNADPCDCRCRARARGAASSPSRGYVGISDTTGSGSLSCRNAVRSNSRRCDANWSYFQLISGCDQGLRPSTVGAANCRAV